MKKPKARTFEVWVWPGVEKEMEITGMALMHSKKPVTKRGIPSFQEATLTISPKPKTKGKDKT